MPVQFLPSDDQPFEQWLRDKCPNVADEILKNLTVSGVHQTTALGNEEEEREAQAIDADKKRKERTRRAVVSALEGNRDRDVSPVDADKSGSNADALKSQTYEDPDQAVTDLAAHILRCNDALIEKLKVKLKIECTPAEVKQLRGMGPAQLLQWIDDKTDDAQPEPAEKAGGNRNLVVMRHGATHLNNQDTSVDRIRGWLDVPLSDEGQEEAEKLAKKIAKDPPDHLVCSDLKRARETCKLVAKACDMDIAIVSGGFRPWNVGDLAGQSSKTAVPILVKYATETPDEAVPGGESFTEFRQRFMGALSDAFDKLDGTIGMVAHHRNERLITAWLAAGAPADGTIDGKEFSKKGEGTAGHETVVIPAGKLAQAAEAKTTKWLNIPDLSKVWDDGHEEPEREPGPKSFQLHISKVDRDKQLVFGWWSVTTINNEPVVDKQDDIIPTSELEDAVYNWVLKSRTQGEMHEEMDVGRCIESMMFTKEKETAINQYLNEMGTGGFVDMRMEGWWGGFKVDDTHTWALIKDGKLPEFSIGGAGRRTEAPSPPPTPLAVPDAPKLAAEPPKQEPVTVNVSVAPSRHKTIKMRRDESGNLIADVFEGE